MIMKLYAKEFFTRKQQALSIEPRAPQENFPEHTHHDFDEIVIVTEGRGRHILNGYPHELYAGMILYIEGQDHHLYENVENLHLTNILFRDLSYFQFLHNIGALLTTMKPEKSLYQVINKKHLTKALPLIDKLSVKSQFEPLQQESQFFQLLTLIKQQQFDVKGIGNNEEKSIQMLNFLQHNFTEHIEWENLAQQFSLPLRTLYRYIKNQTGHTPQHYVNKLRLAEAHYQIRYTDKLITDIAFDCGFNDSCYFSTMFKREFGISPRTLRFEIE